jgi:hypothetical protein
MLICVKVASKEANRPAIKQTNVIFMIAIELSDVCQEKSVQEAYARQGRGDARKKCFRPGSFVPPHISKNIFRG